MMPGPRYAGPGEIRGAGLQLEFGDEVLWPVIPSPRAVVDLLLLRGAVVIIGTPPAVAHVALDGIDRKIAGSIFAFTPFCFQRVKRAVVESGNSCAAQCTLLDLFKPLRRLSKNRRASINSSFLLLQASTYF